MCRPAFENPHFWPQVGALDVVRVQRHCAASGSGGGGHPDPEGGHQQHASIIPLKVERMGTWYLCLMRALQVPIATIMHGFERKPPSQDCFWHPPKNHSYESKGERVVNDGNTNQTCSWNERHWDAPGTEAMRARAGYTDDANNGANIDGASSDGVDAAATAGAAMPPTSSDAASIGKAWHATSARSRVEQFYDSGTAQKVYEMFKDDFRLLKYQEWDGLSRFIDT